MIFGSMNLALTSTDQMQNLSKLYYIGAKLYRAYKKGVTSTHTNKHKLDYRGYHFIETKMFFDVNISPVCVNGNKYFSRVQYRRYEVAVSFIVSGMSLQIK